MRDQSTLESETALVHCETAKKREGEVMFQPGKKSLDSSLSGPVRSAEDRENDKKLGRLVLHQTLDAAAMVRGLRCIC